MKAARAAAPKSAKTRLLLFGLAMLAWGILIVLRLMQLQVIRYGDYVHQAAKQQQRAMEVSPPRGVIYDRKGQVLAMSSAVESVFVVPSEVSDAAGAANALANVLHGDPNELLARIHSQRYFVWIARKLDPDVVNRIRLLNLSGIHFQKETRRVYPTRDLAAQVLGYVGMDNSGLAGIEQRYDTELRGVNGRILYIHDARNKLLEHVEKAPSPGANVILTVDEQIQYFAEKELDAAMRRTQAAAGVIVVQNPKTGEILALANRPSFNPNLSREITPRVLRDHAVSDIFEPGSVFKAVTYSSALEERVSTPEEVMSCDPGYIQVGSIKIHDSHHVGVVSVERAFAESSDVGAVKMALRLGPARFYQYIRAYGFGEPTGIELPGETRGLIKAPANWSVSSIGSMAIGQEVGVTPLQVISMISAMANGGVYNPPRIVAAVTAPTQGFQQIVFRPQGQHRVVSTMTAAQMRRMMEGVVLEGTARRAILNGYTSAGKTGTAQKYDSERRAYSRTDYVASFVGFAPVNDPAVTIAVILDSPHGLHQGGQIAAPVFKRLAEEVLAYMGVRRDVETQAEPERELLRARASEGDTEEAQHFGDEAPPIPAESAAAAPVPVAQAPQRNAPAAATSPAPSAGPAPPRPSAERPGSVVLALGSEHPAPRFVGHTLRSAIEMAQQNGFELEVSGSGIARAQQPPAGTPLPPGSRILVHFAP